MRLPPHTHTLPPDYPCVFPFYYPITLLVFILCCFLFVLHLCLTFYFLLLCVLHSYPAMHAYCSHTATMACVSLHPMHCHHHAAAWCLPPPATISVCSVLLLRSYHPPSIHLHYSGSPMPPTLGSPFRHVHLDFGPCIFGMAWDRAFSGQDWRTGTGTGWCMHLFPSSHMTFYTHFGSSCSYALLVPILLPMGLCFLPLRISHLLVCLSSLSFNIH